MRKCAEAALREGVRWIVATVAPSQLPNLAVPHFPRYAEKRPDEEQGRRSPGSFGFSDSAETGLRIRGTSFSPCSRTG